MHVRLGKQEHALLLTMHHIVTDGWSTGIFIRELNHLYNLYVTGESSPLNELQIQYADFAVWQREWLQGEGLEKQLDYWRRQMAGVPATLDLPTDRRRPVVQTFRSKKQEFVVPYAVSQALSQLSHDEGVTLYMVLLAAFQALLSRYSGQNDLCVGTPIANRNRPEIARLIGCFVNMLVMRADLTGAPSFADFLARVKTTALEAYTNQDLPFERLVEALDLERNMSHTPLAQATFTFQNTRNSKLEFANLQVTPLPIEKAAMEFDISLIMAGDAEGLAGAFIYNADLFDKDSIIRSVNHFQRLLKEVATNPDQKLFEIGLLSEQEQKQLILDWNDTSREFRTDKCVHQLFEQQAQRRPDAIALTWEGRHLSYTDLNLRANRLANHLTRLGVGPESLVGICFERSEELILGLLGILKAGGAYVPLDPAYPKQRLDFIFDDAQIEVLLTQSSLRDRLQFSAAHVICLDSDWQALSQEPATTPASRVDIDNSAYVIYTSGSTGQPKGVAVTHSNVTRLLAATEPWFHFSEEDAWALFHSYAFDFSVWEIWGALIYGSRLIVVPYWTSRSPEAFYALLCDEQVTVLNQTPSAFSQLIQAEEAVGARPDFAARLVIFGGEALDLQSLIPWFNRHGDQRPQLVNMFGITETTVHVTYRPISITDAENALGSMIGRPIPDLQTYVLDSRLQPTPIGVAGELYVGGDGVSRGYLARFDLNAERFIPSPFSDKPGARLYRSGDLARYRPDGDIEYLGRIDNQVKIRGHRIELGEVETALRQLPGLSQAAVIVLDRPAGDKHLAAYFVAEPPAAFTADQLRAALAARLPAFMIPASFTPLAALPLTANGKLDRAALPAVGAARPALTAGYVAPTSALQRRLCEAWAQALRLERVGIHDNYFDLGGDSIRSIQLLAGCQRQGLIFDIHELFLHPTVAELAEVVRLQAPAAAKAPAARFGLIGAADRGLLPAGVEEAYPLSKLQWGMIFHSQLSPAANVYHDVFSYRVRGRFDEAVLRQVLKGLSARHEALRTSFELSGYSEPLQLVWEEAEVRLAVERVSGMSEGEQRRAIGEAIRRDLEEGYEWGRAPLLRVVAHELGEDSFQLTVSLHHAVMDGWSYALLRRQLFRGYWAGLKGEEVKAGGRLKSSYRRYVELEQEALR
ncbi:MAG TPA: amino acid adenylation domain-containing protein, partial [Blastocatellia bacterium]|nr:amino acid adenylation domain-containing protein [Blastocatellia bacterium]